LARSCVSNSDARDPELGRRPDLPPATRRGRPNVLYIVWDDAGIATWDAFGGLIETPAMRWLAARGLRYSQWHTTALASPTRSCLLTGRNCDASGMARAGREWRGQSVVIPAEAGTLAEILAENGYRCYCVGKWHLSPPEPSAMAGPRSTWPLGRGFDRYYGFLGETTSQWDPDLVCDNQHVDAPYPPADGYHLSADLADMAMQFIGDGDRLAPGRPWLCYLSFEANGIPHVAPREWSDNYRGRFEMGYDRYREIVLGNMKRLGVVPEDTGLAPADRRPAHDAAAEPQGVHPWHSLSDNQKQFSSRLAESYAGLCSYTDHQVGRLLSYLEESGQLADTIVVTCSASTAFARGSWNGQLGESGLLVDWRGDAVNGSRYWDLASPASCDHSAAWARAFGTPYNMLGQYSPGGSAASPLIISWPRETKDVAGGVRDQYHHAVDVVPTILDCAAIDLPQVVNGHAQAPLHGVSMRYTFTTPDGPSARRTQRYEIPGARGIYHDGWKAVAARSVTQDDSGSAADTWELYHVSADRAEIHDVAASYPQQAAKLISLWSAAAGQDRSPAPDDEEAPELLPSSWTQVSGRVRA
jgi:arylsulfatase A-like enzyme